MAKGQKTKAGHIIQMIHHGADPNRFNPNGKRVVCHNAEDYDFIEGIEFDKLSRKGAKALIANVPLEEMWTGKISGPPHYNLMDDQIFPFWIAKGTETPVTVEGVNCIDTEYVRPQLDRADRAFFAIEEGKAGGGADLGCYGMFTSFKWTSKRGNKGKSRFEVGFATQAAVPRPALTGGKAQNHKTRIMAANVTGPLGLSILAPGLAQSKTVSLAIGDTAAQVAAKFAAQGLTVAATGGIVQGAGQVDNFSGTGPALSVSGVAVDFAASDAKAKLQQGLRALPGRGSAVVGGTFNRERASVSQGGANPVAVTGGSGPWQGATGNYKLACVYAVNGTSYLSSVATTNLTSGQTPGAFMPNGYESVPEGPANSYAWYLSEAPGSSVLRRVAGATNSGFVPQTAPPATQDLVPVVGGVAVPASVVGGTVSYDAAAGNLGPVAVAGAGYSGTTTAPGGAGGALDIEFTDPANVPVTVNKSSGSAGYGVALTQPGSDGSILGAMLPDDPIMPGHLFLYSAETPLGLDDEANLVGQIEEWEIDDPKICLPISHHVRVNDPERPTLPATYNAHAEEESQEDGIKLSVTMDADEGGVVEGIKALLRASGSRLVSVPRYWRIAAIHPGSVRRVWIDFYGSVGASVPVKWAGSVEQYTFVYDLLENKTAPWNFKAKTRRPA